MKTCPHFFKKITFQKLCVIASDFIFINLAFWLSLLLVKVFFGSTDNYIFDLKTQYLQHTFLASLIVLCLLWNFRHYSYRKAFWFEVQEICKVILLFSIIDLSVSALNKNIISRSILKKYQLWHRDTIIIGISANAIETFRALKSENYLGYRILAFVGNTKHKSLHKIPIINKDEITEVCNSDTQVIIALDSQNQNQLNGWLGFFNTLNFKFITIVPDLDGIPIYGTEISLILNYETLLLRLNNNLSNRFNIFLKRMFDITGSLLLLLFLSPLFLFVIIKINSYQPFFKHQRIGKKGQVFECIKFKSMVDNAQELLPELLQDEKLAREWALNQKFKNDPRVTPIGKWLRRTSLDELPQLFNVLKGEMSLVGPRPVTQNELAKYQDNVKYYLQTTPGMTGLWQINGRSDISYQKRVSFDVWYVKNWSLWLDIAILFKTIPVVFRQKGSV